MFDSKQIELIRQALAECDRCETLALAGEVPIKYQFTKEFEEKAEALKRRVAFRMKATVKRLLIAAVIVVLTLATTLVLVAWPRDPEHAIRFGNAVTENRTMIVSYPDAVLDFTIIDYEKLPVPNGYLYKSDSGNHSLYQKQYEDGTWGPSISVTSYEVFDDSYVLIEHDSKMERMNVGDTIVYYYPETWTSDAWTVERNFYLVKGEKYISYVVTDSSLECERDDLPTHEEIAKIIEAIDDMIYPKY